MILLYGQKSKNDNESYLQRNPHYVATLLRRNQFEKYVNEGYFDGVEFNETESQQIYEACAEVSDYDFNKDPQFPPIRKNPGTKKLEAFEKTDLYQKIINAPKFKALLDERTKIMNAKLPADQNGHAIPGETIPQIWERYKDPVNQYLAKRLNMASFDVPPIEVWLSPCTGCEHLGGNRVKLGQRLTNQPALIVYGLSHEWLHVVQELMNVPNNKYTHPAVTLVSNFDLPKYLGKTPINSARDKEHCGIIDQKFQKFLKDNKGKTFIDFLDFLNQDTMKKHVETQLSKEAPLF